MRINVTRSSMPGFEEYCDEIRDIWDSRWLTNMGSKHQELEERLKSYLGVNNLKLFTNGHLALESVIASFGFPRGAEVITTAFTFASTTHAIVRNGLVPVFCDIDPYDYTMDDTKIEALITDNTVAILPVHVYGHVCHTGRIAAIAAKHGLKVIYDAAHTFGVDINGRAAADYGDASILSFHATKVFHTIEGGAAVYHDEERGEILDDLKNFGIRNPETCCYVGGNAKMSEFQAAMGICNLRHVDEEIEKRKQIFFRYRSLLNNVEGIKLSDAPLVSGVKHNYAYFPVVFEDYKYSRDEVYERLKSQDIYARKYFYPLTCRYACYRDLSVPELPVSERIASNVLTLPIYSGLQNSDIDRICYEIIQ